MKESNLVFEKVSDINMEYPYLCVYIDTDHENAFMDIYINESNEIEYMIYNNIDNIILDKNDWNFIQERAKKFFEEIMKMNEK